MTKTLKEAQEFRFENLKLNIWTQNPYITKDFIKQLLTLTHITKDHYDKCIDLLNNIKDRHNIKYCFGNLEDNKTCDNCENKKECKEETLSRV